MNLEQQIITTLQAGESLTKIEMRKRLSLCGEVSDADVSDAVRRLLERELLIVDGVEKGLSRYRLNR